MYFIYASRKVLIHLFLFTIIFLSNIIAGLLIIICVPLIEQTFEINAVVSYRNPIHA